MSLKQFKHRIFVDDDGGDVEHVDVNVAVHMDLEEVEDSRVGE